MKKTLGQVLADSSENNFNAIRLLMALGVLYNHSFKMFQENGRQDAINYIFYSFDAGSLSVAVFFLISGMLLTQSFFKTSSREKFVLKRLLRIFPGLLVCLLFTVFVVGTINTALTLKQYFSDRAVYRYLYNIFLSNEVFAFDLPGVFSTNKSPAVVNGSLWTLPYELICYIFLFIILSILVNFTSVKYELKQKLFNFLLIVFLGCYLFNPVYIVQRVKGLVTGFRINTGEGNNPLFLFLFFGIGMVFYLFRNQIKLNYLLLLFIAVAVGTTHYLNVSFLQKIVEVSAIAYGTIVLAGAQWLHRANFKLDPSYGIYLYAWPVQQTIAHYYKLGAYESMLITIPVAVLLGCLSFKFIERPALAAVKPFYEYMFKDKRTTPAL